MHKISNLKKLLLLLSVLVMVALPLAAMAQEGAATEAPTEEHGTEAEASTEEHGTEGAAEGEAAAEEAISPLEPLGINAGYLVAQIINFVIIFGALTALLWRPAVNMLDARAAKIEKGLEDAAAAANARRNAEAEAEKVLAAARTEANQVIESSRGRGDEVAKQIEKEARADAEKIREEARIAASAERDAQLAGLRGQVSKISIAVAERLINEKLDAKKQESLIDDFFTKAPKAAKSLSGQVEVVSAMPLSDAEQKKVQKEIGADNVNFTVDPSILGGLIVRSSDKVVDGSVRSGLNDMAGRLN